VRLSSQRQQIALIWTSGQPTPLSRAPAPNDGSGVASKVGTPADGAYQTIVPKVSSVSDAARHS